REYSMREKMNGADLSIQQWRAGTSVARNPEILLVVPVSSSYEFPGFSASREGFCRFGTVADRVRQRGKSLRRAYPICGQREFFAERLLLTASLFLWGDVRRTVVR